MQEKKKKLYRLLEEYGRVAIAFSGGADSSLLLRCAIDSLGAENLLVLTSRSCLLTQREFDRVTNWFLCNSPQSHVHHEFVDVDPLAWEEFVSNPKDRCYLCKNKVYRLFLEKARDNGIHLLIDGTNADDMKSERPGLRVLQELSIGTPLADAGFSKEEVRVISKEIGLSTWNQPSSSCLATRIPSGLEVTRQRIESITQCEAVLLEMGFDGCRFRLDLHDPAIGYVKVQTQDIERLSQDVARTKLLKFFNDFGMKYVYVDMKGR